MKFKYSDLSLFKASGYCAAVILTVVSGWVLFGSISAPPGKAIEAIRPGLEVLSYFATFATGVLSIIAIVGVRIALQQLAVSKGDIRLRSQREAGVLAVQLCERWAQQVIPLMDSTWNLLGKRMPDVPPTDQMLESDLARVPKWTQIANPHFVQVVYLMNAVESVAIYFEQKLADEELAFGPLAVSFCLCVDMFWPAMARYRPDNDQQLFPNTFALYGRWKAQLNKIGLDMQSKRIQAEIRKIPVPERKRPLGTDFP